MAWRFPEHILRGELENTVRGRVTGRIWLAGLAEPMTLDLRGDCAPDLAGCTFTFENPNPVPFDDSTPSLDQRGWVGDITASQKLKVFDLPVEEALALIRSGQDAPWHFANALYLEWHSTTNGGITIQTAEFKLTVSAPAWTFTPGEYEASREATSREFIEWSKTQFGWTDDDLRAAESHDELFDDDAGEEWKREDDDDLEKVDPMLVFDSFDDAEWMPSREILIKYGFTPLRPAWVGGEHLRGRLWELIYALAGRRIYLQCSDHLDDRALYAWLDTFLDEDCADCPLEAEMNYRVDVSDYTNGSDAGVQTWLRFFADEKERAEWQRHSPDDPMPPREKPAHDRDRFLPEPPMPPPAWTPPDSDDPPFDAPAPADVDREIRIEKLKDEIAEAAGSEMLASKLSDLPPAIEEAFLEQVRDLERDGWQRPMDELTKHNAAPLPPEELTDEALPPHLWNLLHHLACRGFYVLHTDHLSDRALY